MTMQTEEHIVRGLKGEGYDSVYAWDAAAHEQEDEHEHPFDTKLCVVRGHMRVTLLRGDKMEAFDMRPGMVIEIAEGQRHAALAGPEGCRYVVGEMH